MTGSDGTFRVPEAISPIHAASIDFQEVVSCFSRFITRMSFDDFVIRVETFRVSNMPRGLTDFDSDATGLYSCVTSTNTHPWHG
jgi:hypothetical protein